MPSATQSIALTVVIPAYNEQDRLPPYLTSITRYLSRRGDCSEVLVVDDGSTDGATPIQELERLERAVAEGADLAIGSRFLASRDDRYHVHARRHRTILGNLFNHVAQRLGLAGITDTQCGFKLFRRRVAADLFSVGRIAGYGFDLELLYIARLRK